MEQRLLNDHQQTVTRLMSQAQNLLREMGLSPSPKNGHKTGGKS